MRVHILLLRGVNLDPRRRVATADVRRALALDGYADIATHLQSGNIVLRSALSREEVGGAVALSLTEQLGLTTSVLVRSPAELASAAQADPVGRWQVPPQNRDTPPGTSGTQPDGTSTGRPTPASTTPRSRHASPHHGPHGSRPCDRAFRRPWRG